MLTNTSAPLYPQGRRKSPWLKMFQVANQMSVDDDNVALETSLRFLRGGPQTWTLKLFDVELSAPAEARINAALTRLLDGEEANEVVAQIQPPFSASVSRQSLQTLKSGERLNDEVMNFFIRKHNLYAARCPPV